MRIKCPLSWGVSDWGNGEFLQICMEMGKSEDKILLTAGGIIHFTNLRNY